MRSSIIHFGGTIMKSRIIVLAIAAGVAFAAQDATALGTKEKGCLVGGAAGGVGGHLLGDHALLGAAAGCAVGTVVQDQRQKKDDEAKRHEEDQRKQAHRQRRHDEAVRREEVVRSDGTRSY
jgi:hypothetical protein